MKNPFTVAVQTGFLFFLLFCPAPAWAEELYIITTSEGSQIIVKEYTLTDEQVQFTTPNDSPGFIKRNRYVSIAKMTGDLPRLNVPTQESLKEKRKRETLVWIAVAFVLVILNALFLFFVIRKKTPDT